MITQVNNGMSDEETTAMIQGAIELAKKNGTSMVQLTFDPALEEADEDNICFGCSLKAMEEGEIVSREGWTDDRVVFKQIQATIPANAYGMMKSWPINVKKFMVNRANESGLMEATYRNQYVTITADNNIVAYTPTPEDMNAEDWFVVE